MNELVLVVDVVKGEVAQSSDTQKKVVAAVGPCVLHKLGRGKVGTRLVFGTTASPSPAFCMLCCFVINLSQSASQINKMAGKFEPKTPVVLNPPRDDPITLEELAKANGASINPAMPPSELALSSRIGSRAAPWRRKLCRQMDRSHLAAIRVNERDRMGLAANCMNHRCGQ